jgi:EpsI family protein
MTTMRNVRAFLPAFVLLVGCAFIWNARSQRPVPLAAPLSTVLPDVPGYRMQEQQLSPDERKAAGMNSYVARAYWRDSIPAFSIFVSYYERQTQGRTIHSPRNCLPGAGWDVITNGTAALTSSDRKEVVNRYVLKNEKGATAVVYYWYQGRGRVVANEYAVKWNLLRDAALAGHTEEALVRVVVPVIPGRADSPDAARSIEAANALGANVATRLLTDVSHALPVG